MAVVIPCFNDGETLLETLASLKGEEPHELVVVDDGSSDPTTKTLLSRLGREGVQVVRQRNAGPAAARMTGVLATRAPYVMPLDSDDRIAEGALSRLADVLDLDELAGFAYGDYRIFGSWSGMFRSPRPFDPWMLLWANPYGACSLVRRNALLACGGWKSDIPGYEDWDLWLSLVEHNWHGVHAGCIAYERRLHGERGQSKDRRRHGELTRALRARHPRLYGSEGQRELRRLSAVGPARQLAYPLAARIRPHVSPMLEQRLLRLLTASSRFRF